ncbi:MAG: hypothetical protein AB7E49_03005 [Campylobacterales bacterium]
MNTAGLSLDQAPPFGVPLRFFLAAPLFGLLAGFLLLAGGGDLLLNRYHPHTLALVHLLTLGVMGMVMTGALFQMLPVIAGVVLPRARLLGAAVFGALGLGALFLCWGFATAQPLGFAAGGVLLAAALTVFAVTALVGLFRVEYANVTVKLMRLALIALMVTVLLGAHLATGHAAQNLTALTPVLADLHASWGLAGWTALLILGVAQQVLPMFYVTPPYPKFCRTVTGPLIFISLIAATGLAFYDLAIVAKIGVGVGLVMLGSMTFARTLRRKRKAADGSLRYWQFSMVALILSVPLLFVPGESATGALAVLFIGGFVLSLINGMLYKIVPFLAWFHLSATFRPDLPTMHDFIPKKAVYTQMGFHIAALVFLLTGLFLPYAANLGGAALIAAYGLLLKDLAGAARVYARSGGGF